MAKRLTAASVEKEKPDPKKRLEIGDDLLAGLYLVIQPSGAKSWAVRYRLNKVPKKLTIGPVLVERRSAPPAAGPILGQGHTLAEAREAARRALQAIAEGHDPTDAKRAAAAALRPETDEEILAKHAASERDFVRIQGAAFIDKWCKPKNRAWPEVERQFKKEINPVIGERDVKTVTKRDISDLLDAIAERGSPITANRVFATLRRFFGWLVEKHVLAENPCTGIRRPVEETPRERVLTDSELQVIWRATAAFTYPFSALWKLLLLTGQRREEVAGMEWSELSLAGNWPEWKLPGERTKNKRAHDVPLSPLAVAIISEIPRSTKLGTDGRVMPSEFVFTTTGATHISGYSRAKARLDEVVARLLAEADEAASMPHWSLHDLRRTFATRLAGFGVRLEVTEKVLNHVSGSFGGIVAVYQRHDFDSQKREALDAWARYVELLVDDVLWPLYQKWVTAGDRDEERARRREFNAAILEGGGRWLSVLSSIRGEPDEKVVHLRG